MFTDLLGKYPSIRERLYDEFYNRDLPGKCFRTLSLSVREYEYAQFRDGIILNSHQ